MVPRCSESLAVEVVAAIVVEIVGLAETVELAEIVEICDCVHMSVDRLAMALVVF
jgi:hypothetical protein